jgi:hypothetical protein
MLFTDVMVDIETTGTMPDRNAMIQLSAVRFNLAEGTVDPDIFNRCLWIPTHRFWDEGTRRWWMDGKKDILRSIMDRMECPRVVLQDFIQWAGPTNSLRFWSKPSHFDFNFLSSYCHDLELTNPFSFREANDMNTFLRCLYFPERVPSLDIPFEGEAHDAIWDVFHQIKTLLAHHQAVRGLK